MKEKKDRTPKTESGDKGERILCDTVQWPFMSHGKNRVEIAVGYIGIGHFSAHH